VMPYRFDTIRGTVHKITIWHLNNQKIFYEKLFVQWKGWMSKVKPLMPIMNLYWVLISESKCANPIKATNFIQTQMTYKLFSKFPSLMDFVHKRQWQVVLLPCWCHHESCTTKAYNSITFIQWLSRDTQS